ncbi:hypothetical protein BT69DRAFT_1350840 [Atractiella rhizophila]|nr:hypothetical protein BT69DRAFT_1350840 [Atractiella rhizophila]
MDEPNQPLFDPEKSFENFLRQRRTAVTEQESLVKSELKTLPQQAVDNWSSSQATTTSNGAILGDEKVVEVTETAGKEEPIVPSEGVEQAQMEEAEKERQDEMPAPAPVDEPQCRICFGGEDAELGRLISPCLCRGSIGLVHVTCLNEWRRASPTTQSYFECPQCHYHYRLERTRIAGLAESKPALFSLTVLLYLLLIFFSGHIATYFLSFSSSGTSLADSYYTVLNRGEILDNALQTALRGISTALNMDFSFVMGEDEDEEEDAAYDLLIAALSGVDLDSLDVKEDGILRLTPDEHGDAIGRAAWHLQRAREKKEEKKRAKKEGRPAEGSITPTWGMKMTFHFLLGLVFISLLSVLQILLSISFFGPFRHMTWGRRGGRGGGVNLEGIVLVAVVAYGSVKVFMTCWRWTKIGVRWGLKRIETRVLEVER